MVLTALFLCFLLKTGLTELNQSVENKTSSEVSEGDINDLANLCDCQPESTCNPEDSTRGIDIRIVTPPSGVECTAGLVYCCFSGHHSMCGVRRNNISAPILLVKDGQSRFGEYPWQALIVNLDNDYIGSGVIMDSRHIITAAHKVATRNKHQLVVRAGEWDVRFEREPFSHLDVRVLSVAIHPQFNPRNLNYDVAVLKLSQPLRLYPTVPHINSICLPSQTYNFTGRKCWVSGWGKDMYGPSGHYQYTQKAVDVHIVSGSECQQQMRRTRLGRHFTLDTDSFLCAGGEKDKDACSGDGGSPLVCLGDEGRWMLAGLVAWGIGCAQPDVPGVYVNVATMVPWLQQCTS